MYTRVSTWMVVAVFALLALPAQSAEDSMSVSFEGASCFNADFSAFPQITYSGLDVLDVRPFGPSHLDWHINVLLTATGLEFVSGAFLWTIPSDDEDSDSDSDSDSSGTQLLGGNYTGFSVDPATGAYELNWDFTGGTEDFEDVTGTGQTQGVVDLATLCAEYTFSGVLTENDD